MDIEANRGMARTRCEAVSLGEVRRARHGARHLVQALAVVRLDGEHGAQKALGVLVDGVGEQLFGGSRLNNLAGVHNGDLGGNLGHECQVVRHEDHGEAKLLLQVVQELDDLLLHRHVERGGGARRR